MDIGTKIRQLRLERRLSQEALADALGVSRQAVTKWENNLSRPGTANLLALCRQFGISPGELSGADGNGPRGGGAQRRELRRALLTACAVLLPVSLAALAAGWREAPPAGVIGYADIETGITVSGVSPCALLLCALTVCLAAAALFLTRKPKHRRKERGK